MDGTLLNSSKRISPRTLAALHSIASRGVHVCLSTGRAAVELSEYREAMRGTVTLASLLSGGHLFDLEHQTTIEAHPFETKTALAIAQQGLRENAMVVVLTTSQTAALAKDVERMDQLGLGIYKPLYRQHCTMCDDVLAYIEAHEGEVCKVNLYHPGQEARARSAAQLAGLPVQAAYSEAASLECSPAGVSKASGLKALCDHVGIGLEQAIAVGDGLNDLDVLRVAGLSVAMGNAADEVKALADVVVADNDHDGIVEVVERYL
jgi:Cof subfamily protein (haloacid dehalogenase superfamily)